MEILFRIDTNRQPPFFIPYMPALKSTFIVIGWGKMLNLFLSTNP